MYNNNAWNEDIIEYIERSVYSLFTVERIQLFKMPLYTLFNHLPRIIFFNGREQKMSKFVWRHLWTNVTLVLEWQQFTYSAKYLILSRFLQKFNRYVVVVGIVW